MKKKMTGLAWLALAFATGLQAQRLDLSSLDKLASKARESQNIDLNPDTLKLAAGFLAGDEKSGKGDQGLAELSKISNMAIRSFEFDAAGAYAQADVEGIRRQLQSPGWSRVMEINDKDESVGIWIFKGEKESGMAMLAQEPKELTVINIVGVADLASLGKLGKLVNLPEIRMGFDGGKKSSAPPAKKSTAKPPQDEE